LQSFNSTRPPNATTTHPSSRPWFISRLLWTQSALSPITLTSTWSVTNGRLLYSNPDEPFFTVYCHPLGYDSFISFCRRVSMSYSATRGYHLPPRAILASHCLPRNKRDLSDDRAEFLNFSLLDDVSHLCFHLKVCCSTKTLMRRSKNKYITVVLTLLMLASVCQFNFRFAMCADPCYALQLGGCVGSIVTFMMYTGFAQRDKLVLSITCVLFCYY